MCKDYCLKNVGLLNPLSRDDENTFTLVMNRTKSVFVYVYNLDKRLVSGRFLTFCFVLKKSETNCPRE